MAVNTYVPLMSVTLASDTASVAFSGFPTSDDNGDYKHLILIVSATTGKNADADPIYMRLNSDMTASYSYQITTWNVSPTGSGTDGTTAFIFDDAASGRDYRPGGFLECHILNFSSTTLEKVFFSDHYTTISSNRRQSGRWANTDPIESIYLYPQSETNFLAGSKFSLYALHG